MINYYRIFYQLIIAFALLAIGSAYFLSYYYNIPICKLCYWQQLILLAIILLSTLALLRAGTYHGIIGLIITVLFFGDIVISSYHVLVQEKVIKSILCNSPAEFKADSLNFEDFKKQLTTNANTLNANSPNETNSCESKTARFIGISLAGYNLIFSSIMFAFSAIFNFAFSRFKPVE